MVNYSLGAGSWFFRKKYTHTHTHTHTHMTLSLSSSVGTKALIQVEGNNIKLITTNKRLLEHRPVTSPPVKEKKVTYPVILTPNFAFKSFSPKMIGKFRFFDLINARFYSSSFQNVDHGQDTSVYYNGSENSDIQKTSQKYFAPIYTNNSQRYLS